MLRKLAFRLSVLLIILSVCTDQVLTAPASTSGAQPLSGIEEKSSAERQLDGTTDISLEAEEEDDQTNLRYDGKQEQEDQHQQPSLKSPLVKTVNIVDVPSSLMSPNVEQRLPVEPVQKKLKSFNIVINNERVKRQAFIQPDVFWLRELAPRIAQVAGDTEETIRNTVLSSVRSRSKVVVNVLNMTVQDEDEIPTAAEHYGQLLNQKTSAEHKRSLPTKPKRKPVVINVMIFNILPAELLAAENVSSLDNVKKVSTEEPTQGSEQPKREPVHKEEFSYSKPLLVGDYLKLVNPGKPGLSAMEQPAFAEHTLDIPLTPNGADLDADLKRRLENIENYLISLNTQARRPEREEPPRSGSSNAASSASPVVTARSTAAPRTTSTTVVTTTSSTTTSSSATTARAVPIRSNNPSNRMKTLGFTAIPTLAGAAVTWQYWWPALAALAGRRKRSTDDISEKEKLMESVETLLSEARDGDELFRLSQGKAIDEKWLSLLMGHRYLNASKEDLRTVVDAWKDREQLSQTAETTSKKYVNLRASDLEPQTSSKQDRVGSPYLETDAGFKRIQPAKIANNSPIYYSSDVLFSLKNKTRPSTKQNTTLHVVPVTSTKDFDLVSKFVQSSLSKLVDDSSEINNEFFLINGPLKTSGSATSGLPDAVNVPVKPSNQRPSTGNSFDYSGSISTAATLKPVIMSTLGPLLSALKRNFTSTSPQPRITTSYFETSTRPYTRTTGFTSTTSGRPQSTTPKDTANLVDLINQTLYELLGKETTIEVITEEPEGPTVPFSEPFTKSTRRPTPSSFSINPFEVPNTIVPRPTTKIYKLTSTTEKTPFTSSFLGNTQSTRFTSSTTPTSTQSFPSRISTGTTTTVRIQPSATTKVPFSSTSKVPVRSSTVRVPTTSTAFSRVPTSSTTFRVPTTSTAFSRAPTSKVVTPQATSSTLNPPRTTARVPVTTTVKPLADSSLVADVLSNQQILEGLLKDHENGVQSSSQNPTVIMINVKPTTASTPPTTTTTGSSTTTSQKLSTEAVEAEDEYDSDYDYGVESVQSSFNITTTTPVPNTVSLNLQKPGTSENLDVISLINQLQSNGTSISFDQLGNMMSSTSSGGIHFLNTSTDIYFFGAFDATPSSVGALNPVLESVVVEPIFEQAPFDQSIFPPLQEVSPVQIVEDSPFPFSRVTTSTTTSAPIFPWTQSQSIGVTSDAVVVEAAPSLENAPAPSLPNISSNANLLISSISSSSSSGSSISFPSIAITSGTSSTSTSSTSSTSFSSVALSIGGILAAGLAYAAAALLPFWLPVFTRRRRFGGFNKKQYEVPDHYDQSSEIFHSSYARPAYGHGRKRRSGRLKF